LRAFFERVRGGGGSPQVCEIEIDLPPLGRRTLSVTAAHVWHDEAATRWVLLSLNDITDFRRSEQELAEAKRAAEQANLAKSRFLAAVSHDLRQPLQTLTLLHDGMHRRVSEEQRTELLSRAEAALDSMSGMLDALLDINQLETGAIEPHLSDFPIEGLLGRLDSEYGMHARALGLNWRVVHSRLAVHSDPRLLERMVRNLVSNALRYTEQGKVLLGCRRRRNSLRIEVWDTGIGIAEEEIPKIFEEYHKAPGQADESSLGLGLAIVQRLGELLRHPIGVRSKLGTGSVFSIEVPLVRAAPIETPHGPSTKADHVPHRRGAILLIEDAATVRTTLERMLANEGHRTAAAASGAAALELVAGGFHPDLIIVDFALAGGVNGVEAATAVSEAVGRKVPAIFLTGDIRSASLHEIDRTGGIRFAQPARPNELSRAIQRLLAARAEAGEQQAAPVPSADARLPATVLVVDDDPGVRKSLRALLTAAGYRVEAFASAEALLAADRGAAKGCLVVDVRMPGMSGFELLARLAAAGNMLPAILLTGHGDVAMAVEAMKAGAEDFIEKPVRPEQLLAAIDRALRHAATPVERSAWRNAAALRIAGLTQREREVMELVVAGHANKEIAARLGISQRTIENHRAAVMKRMGATSLSELVRLALAGAGIDSPRQ
jgi:two-component system CheB/CheR fusion protein